MEHQPNQAGPLPFAARELAAFATCLSVFGHQGKNKKTKQKNCSEQVIARGKQRSKETAPKEGRGSQERLEPTLFLVGCGFRTLIAPQQDRIRDSHMETP